jgi:hypothetical protein
MEIMHDDSIKTFIRNLPWLSVIILIALWLRFDIDFNSASPLENAYILKGKLVYTTDNFSFNYDKFSSVLPAYFTGLAAYSGGYLGARAFSLLVSVLMLFFFYKFSMVLLKNKLAAIFSLLFFALQAPVIFISKYVSSDIISLTFFTAFLWLSAKISEPDNKTNIKHFIIASIIFIFAVLTNYLLLVFLPVVFFIFMKKNIKLTAIFTSIVLAVLLLLYILFFDFVNHQLAEIFSINKNEIKYSKLLVRIAEYIAIPIMFLIAAQQIAWKTQLKKTIFYAMLALPLIIPIYIVIFRDVFIIYRLIPFSLLFLCPLGGLVLSQFVKMNPSHKYATIFTLYFISLLSLWHTSQLEDSFANTDSVIEYCKKNINKNSIIYCEDPYLISANFYPKIDIKNFRNLYYNKQFYNNNTYYNREQLTSAILSGEIDLIILNGLVHPGFSEELKTSYISSIYNIKMREEINFNSLLYPINYGKFEIFQIIETIKKPMRFFATKLKYD